MFPSSLQKPLHFYFNARTIFVVSCIGSILLVLLSLNYVLKNHVLENHFLNSSVLAHFRCPLNQHDMELLNRTFGVFLEVVEGANLTYFIYAGTLIGSLRHHNRIPWDDDVDVMMRADEKPRIKEVLSTRNPDYALLITGSEYSPVHWKFYPKAGRNVSDSHHRTPCIDLFFYGENETHNWNTDPDYYPEETWLKRHIFPLHRRPFGEFSVTAPCNGPVVIGPDFNFTVCISRSFNHMIDMFILSEPMSVPCDRLAHMHPFVRSHQVNGSSVVVETLMLGNRPISSITTQTPC